MGDERSLGTGIAGAAIGLGIVALPGGIVFATAAAFSGATIGFAVGSAIGSVLFPPKVSSKLARNHDFSITAATEGAPVAIIYGERIARGQIVFFGFDQIDRDGGNVGGGKGGGPPDPGGGVKVYAPVHIVLCHGPATLVSVKTFKGVDWISKNARRGGRPLDISTPPSTRAPFPNPPIPNDPANTSTERGFGYKVAAAAVLKGITSVHSSRYYLGRNANSFPPLIFNVRVKPLTTVDAATGEYLNNPFFDLPGTESPEGFVTIGDNMIYRYNTADVPGPTRKDIYHGANPAACYWDILTNDQYGIGLQTSKLDTASFRDAHAIFRAEFLAFNVRIDAQTSVSEVIHNLNFHCFTILRTNSAGQIAILPLRQGNHTVHSIGQDDIRDLNVGVKSFHSVVGEFVGTFPGSDVQETPTTVNLKNEAVIQITGQRAQETYDFQWFTDIRLVNGALTRLKKQLSFPTSLMAMKTSKRFHLIKVGDCVDLTHADFGFGVSPNSPRRFRVMEVTDAELGKLEINIRGILETDVLYSNYVDPVPNPEDIPPPSTAADPLGAFAMSAYWRSHLSWVDDGPHMTPQPPFFPAGFKTYTTAGRGQGTDIAMMARLEERFTQGDTLPSNLPGTTLLFDFGYRMVLKGAPILKGEWRYANRPALNSFILPQSVDKQNLTIICELLGFAGQTLNIDQHDSIDSTGFPWRWETDPLVLIVGGREVIRFKNYIRVTADPANGLPDNGNNYYMFIECMRGANKEGLYAWPIGTEVWLARLTEPQAGPAYSQWTGRQHYVSEAQYASVPPNSGDGTRRIRSYTQAMAASGDVQDEEDGTTYTFDKSETLSSGVTRKTNLYANDDEIAHGLAPMTSCCAMRFGDGLIEDLNIPWYSFTRPRAGVFDIYTFSLETNGTVTGPVIGNGSPTNFVAGDWAVYFLPMRDDTTGFGDRIIYDSQGGTIPQELNGVNWPVDASVAGASEAATNSAYTGQVYKCQAFKRIDGTAIGNVITATIRSTLASPILGNWERWPVFRFVATAGTLVIAGYTFDPNADYFKVWREVTVAGTPRPGRPTIATKMGPWTNRVRADSESAVLETQSRLYRYADGSLP